MEFAHFALESGMVLSRELGECSNVLVVSIPDEQERKSNIRIRNGF